MRLAPPAQRATGRRNQRRNERTRTDAFRVDGSATMTDSRKYSRAPSSTSANGLADIPRKRGG